jgi:hypothetical protein
MQWAAPFVGSAQWRIVFNRVQMSGDTAVQQWQQSG